MAESAEEKVILVVDDDPDICEGITDILEEEGYRVVTAANGMEALARLRDGVPVRLILLDLMMPTMDAVQFRAEQRRDFRISQIPIVIVSAGRDLMGATQELGAADYVAKPFKRATLLNTMRKCLNETVH